MSKYLPQQLDEILEQLIKLNKKIDKIAPETKKPGRPKKENNENNIEYRNALDTEATEERDTETGSQRA